MPRYRQKMLFPIHHPKPRPAPKLDHDEVAELIRREYRRPDGSPISEVDADHWAGVFLHHLRFEPGPMWMPPRPRKRPERPTAERLRGFLGVETDWIRT